MQEKFVRQWDHADSPLLWIEMIWVGDVQKMKQYFGFRYGGHYFVSINQTTTFYKNADSERRARRFGVKKYSDARFIKMYCQKSIRVEKMLRKSVAQLQRTILSRDSNTILKKRFDKFFDRYASLMAFYRFSRPEFYEKVISRSTEAQEVLAPVGKRRFAMHRAWMEAFKKAEPLFKEIGARIGLSALEVKNCTREEILAVLSGKGKMVSRNVVRQRISGFAFVYKDGLYAINAGIVKSEELKHKVKRVKGQIAYSGIVRGRVFYVSESLKGISVSRRSIPNHAVLVTVMTSPDMLSLMKRAVAFVTDEGGMLCHAAIVAREMRKPCIIGTQVATKVFKDGDRVEVDATHGIVRKI